MLRPILVLAPLLLATALSAAPRGEATAPWPAIGSFRPPGGSGRHGCTAFLVAPDLVVTARHCVGAPRAGDLSGQRIFEAGLSRGDSLGAVANADIYWPDGDRDGVTADRALVRLAAPLAPVAPLPVADPPPAGTRVAVIGYEQRGPAIPVRRDCHVERAEPPLFGLDCEVVGGLSGAPVLWRRADGWHAVGIVVARREPEGLGLALPLPSSLP